MNAKITLPKEVADAVEYYRSQGFSDASIVATAVTNGGVGSRAKALVYFVTANKGNSDVLMHALVNGFDVEKTPEIMLREYWADVMFRWSDADGESAALERYYEGSHDAIITVLGILGITIEGVNA
jgi:hypothetical protein